MDFGISISRQFPVKIFGSLAIQNILTTQLATVQMKNFPLQLQTLQPCLDSVIFPDNPTIVD